VFADPSPANAGQQARAIAPAARDLDFHLIIETRARARRGLGQGGEEERWAPVIDAVVFA